MYFLDTYEVRQFNISTKYGKCESNYNSRVDKDKVLDDSLYEYLISSNKNVKDKRRNIL